GDDRRLAPRELETVAQSAVEVRDALAPLRSELAKATGSKKGAITKHLNRVLEALLTGGELTEEDAELVAGVDLKSLEKTRELGNGLLREVLEAGSRPECPPEMRAVADDLAC